MNPAINPQWLSAAVAVIGMVAGLLALLARKDAALATATTESVRLEIRADMAAMELRLMTAVQGEFLQRLTRIEERVKGMGETIDRIETGLSHLQKFRAA
jgi:hypothetical protein